MRKRKLKLRKVDVIYRRSEGRIRAYVYEPIGDVVSKIYDYAKSLWEKYRIVVKLKTVFRNGKRFVVISQDRSFVENGKNVPSISIYVDVETGFLYVPESYFEKYDPFFVYACCQYVVYGLDYEVRSKSLSKLRYEDRKIYISKSPT